MASKDESLGRTFLHEVELGIEQAGELSQAWGKAATRAWTLGLRATVEAYDAATKDRSAKAKGKETKRTTTETVHRLGEGLREFARHATVGYSAALRDGIGCYADALKQAKPRARAKPVERKKTKAASRVKAKA
jgi:hypothetical protein